MRAEKRRDKIFRMGFGFAWSASDHININRFLKDYKQRLKDISYQKWLGEMFNDNKTKNERNKLRTFRKFKINYNLENYLIAIPVVKHRTSLTRLRISDHKLHIEKGRHTRPYTKEEERICPTCKKEVETEFHFLVKCKTYNHLRKQFLDEIKCPDMTEEPMFRCIINPPTKIASKAARHVHQCFQLRDHKLKTEILLQ